MDPLDINERAHISGQKSDLTDPEVALNPKDAERRLVRKIEWVGFCQDILQADVNFSVCIIPLVTVLYLLNFIEYDFFQWT